MVSGKDVLVSTSGEDAHVRKWVVECGRALEVGRAGRSATY